MFNKKKIDYLDRYINQLHDKIGVLESRLNLQQKKINSYGWAYLRKPKYNIGEFVLDDNDIKGKIIHIEPVYLCNEYCFVYHLHNENGIFQEIREHKIKRKVR